MTTLEKMEFIDKNPITNRQYLNQVKLTTQETIKKFFFFKKSKWSPCDYCELGHTIKGHIGILPCADCRITKKSSWVLLTTKHTENLSI